MNVSTAPRVHMYISARLSCLESSTTQIYTISYYIQVTKGYFMKYFSLLPLWKYCSCLYLCVLSYIYKAVLAIPSTPNYS